MDIITIDRFRQLAEGGEGAHLSIYMPTHRAGPETRQGPIRLANLLRDAEERLRAGGMRTPDVRAMLQPARALLDDSGFWNQQSDGLALFLTPAGQQLYRLPASFAELVVVAERFHLKPILPLFAEDGLFYILALSQNQIRLLEGTLYTVGEVDLASLPQSLADALRYDQIEAHLQFRTGTSPGVSGWSATYHGHSPEDEEKDRLLRWFHLVDDALPELLNSRQAPVVLAGVEYLHPIFREASSLSNLLDEEITGNPEELRPDQLHASALELLEPLLAQKRVDAQARYRQMAGTGLASADLEQVVLAAHHGRVEVLFVEQDRQVWGACDLAAQQVTVHDAEEPGDEDLLDLAAVQSILNGGRVYVVAAEQMPADALAAAIYRY
jgi:hypothetical protein